jgi:DNA primase
VLRQVVELYHETLKQSPEALRIWKRAASTHPEMIDHFQLGFANRTLGYTAAGEEPQGGSGNARAFAALGILRDSGARALQRIDCDSHLDLAGRRARHVRAQDHAESARGHAAASVSAGPHRGVWNEEALGSSKEIILCESLIDALTFWCAGFRNVTASYGVNGFTEDHRAAFQKHGVRNVWIAYDRDEAGDAAAERLKEELEQAGHRLASRAVSAGHGRERIRAEGDAGIAEPGRAAQQRRVA